MATIESIAGIAGLVVIAYIIISSAISLFRPSPALEPVPVAESLDGTEAQQYVGDIQAQAPKSKEKTSRSKSAIIEIIETIVMTILIFAAVRLLVQNFRIEGNSMEPNLHNGQYLIIEKVSYRFSEPQRGDIIVFHYPSNPKRDFIKRIIGLPGETLQVQRGQVLINGNPLPESYQPNEGTYNWGPGLIGEEEYFVLGDNRNNSSDSHSWGMLPRDLIVGKAWFTYWPISDWGVIPHYTFPESVSELHRQDTSDLPEIPMLSLARAGMLENQLRPPGYQVAVTCLRTHHATGDMTFHDSCKG
jgi:signal peptidase I